MSDIPRQYADLFKARGFDLRERIGFGASGTVFRAHQSSVDREVAIKVFDPPATTTSEALRARFQREAKLLARVNHPSIPVVLTAGTISTTGPTGPTPYFVMQYIRGETLGAVIKRQRFLPLATAVSHGTELLGALGAAHHARIVHRDVKPVNIVIAASGHCHLIDFSIGVNLNVEPGFTRLTTDGRQQPGTLDYMAPEAQSTTEADPRADIYSLGVVLFEMLAGHPRISVDTLDEDLSKLPVAARDFLRTACARDPEARYQDAEEARRALSGVTTSPRDRSGRGSALCKNVRCPKAQRGFRVRGAG